MGVQSQNIFVNLPVTDLPTSMEFFKHLGFEFNMQYTDKQAACLVLGENIFAMLLNQDFFQTFVSKPIANTKEHAAVIVALSLGSKEEVVEVVAKALKHGASRTKEPIDHGFMYVESFTDLDGHLWEFAYMNH